MTMTSSMTTTTMTTTTTTMVVTIVSALSLWMWFGRRGTNHNRHVDVKALQKLPVAQDTLFALLQPHLVPFETLRQRGYDKVLQFVQLLIGVQPTCDVVLEIWPPAFCSYNILVPNLFDLPDLLLTYSDASKQLVSIAGYVSSRANQCVYCSSHMCSFAMRRATSADVMKEILDVMETRTSTSTNATGSNSNNKEDTSNLSRRVQAVVQVAYGLGSVPCSLQKSHVEELCTVLEPASASSNLLQIDVERIVGAIALFGAFNKLMDGLGVPLEPTTFAETRPFMGEDRGGMALGKVGQMISATNRSSDKNMSTAPPPPPADNWKTRLQVVWLGLHPNNGAHWFNRQLLRGMPTEASNATTFLQTTVGHGFETAVGSLRHGRVVAAVTAAVVRNFDNDTSAGLTVRRKVLAGALFAQRIGNTTLYNDMVAVGTARYDLSARDFDSVVDRHNVKPSSPSLSPSSDIVLDLCLELTEALSVTPNRVSVDLVGKVRAVGEHIMSPAMLVELVSFLATLQMMHRLICFYEIKKALPGAGNF